MTARQLQAKAYQVARDAGCTVDEATAIALRFVAFVGSPPILDMHELRWSNIPRWVLHHLVDDIARTVKHRSA